MKKLQHKSNILYSLIPTFDLLSEPWGIKDTESRHIYMNKAAKMYTSTPESFDVEGRLDSEFPATWSEMSEDFEEHDRKTENSGSRIAVIETDYWFGRNEMEPYFSEKLPIFDDQKRCIGTIWNARKVKVISTLACIGKEKPGILHIDSQSDTFTENEMNIIFLLMKRHSHKEISNILSIAVKTVSNRIQNIKEKAGVHSVRQLEDFCRELGLESYLPKNLVKKGIRFV